MISKLKTLKLLLRDEWNKYSISLLIEIFLQILDIISVILIYPILQVILGQNNDIIFFQYRLENNEVIFYGVLLMIITGIFRLILNKRNIYSVQKIGRNISRNIFSKYLNVGSFLSIDDETSNISKNFTSEINRLTNNTLMPSIKFFGQIILISMLFSIMIWSSKILSLILILMTSVLFVVIYILSNKRINENAKIISDNLQNLYRILQDSVSGKNEIFIYKLKNVFYKNYNSIITKNHYRTANSQFISSLGKPLIEAVIFPLFFISLYFWVSNTNDNVISKLGLFLFASLKLISASQGILSNWTLIKTNFTAVENLFFFNNLLEKISIKEGKNFKISELFIKNLSFKWSKDYIIKNLSIKAKSGQLVIVTGASGSGKSTLFKLIIGTLIPSSGNIIINKKPEIKNFQHSIAYVPQNPLIWNLSPIDNVIFGMNDKPANFNRAYNCIKKVGLNDIYPNINMAKSLRCGERGSKLSGGQIVRLALARALYSGRNLILLDEVTSSLDKKTSIKILNTLKEINLNKIIMLITHKEEDSKYGDFKISL